MFDVDRLVSGYYHLGVYDQKFVSVASDFSSIFSIFFKRGVAYPSMKKTVFISEAEAVAASIGIHWNTAKFETEDFRYGMEVEYEHGTSDPQTNVTNDDPLITGKIAWAHLKEYPDYYRRLRVMEAEAEAYWAKKHS